MMICMFGDGGLYLTNINENILSPRKIAENTKFKYIATGSYNTLAIDKEGNLWGGGTTNMRQLGSCYNTVSPYIVPFQKILEGNFIAGDIDGFYITNTSATVLIEEGGTLYGAGSNSAKSLFLENKLGDYNIAYIVDSDGFQLIK